MRTLHFHMPHFHLPHRGQAHGAEHHHKPMTRRFRQIESAVDFLVVGGIVLLGAAMAYGLLTASGESAWW